MSPRAIWLTTAVLALLVCLVGQAEESRPDSAFRRHKHWMREEASRHRWSHIGPPASGPGARCGGRWGTSSIWKDWRGPDKTWEISAGKEIA